ncbi:MAG: hypothetical protein LBE14_08125, partial [Treponema sp.]|nr:hypothetical protein [Treponema sp.]
MAFLDNLLTLFGGGKDPDSGKKRQIKQLIKDLQKNKYARFYRIKQEEIDGSLGKFFYDIYKTIFSAQVFLQNAAKSAQLKQAAAEAFFDKNLKEIRGRISPETIEERVKTTAIKDLAKQIGGDLAAFSAAFDSSRMEAIDRGYNLILTMVQFTAFDFFFLLKKF